MADRSRRGAGELTGVEAARRSERGVALVEFAIVGTLLFTLIFGIIDYGVMLNRDSLINNAAREAAREGSLNPKRAEIEAVVRSELSSLDQSATTVGIGCRFPDGSPCSGGAGESDDPAFDTNAESGGVVIVTVEYEYPWMTFVPQTIYSDGTITLSKTIEMRIE